MIVGLDLNQQKKHYRVFEYQLLSYEATFRLENYITSIYN